MLWILVIFPVLGMILIAVVAVLLGRRDREKEAKAREERSKNLLVSNPKQAVLQKLDSIKHISEYTFIDVHTHKAKMDCLYISKKGIFLIYVIGYDGVITGEIDKEHWVNKRSEEYVLKNPLYENRRDVEIIGDITSERLHVYPLVVCTVINEINIAGNSNQVIKIDDIEKALESYPDVISPDDLVLLYNNVSNSLNEN